MSSKYFLFVVLIMVGGLANASCNGFVDSRLGSVIGGKAIDDGSLPFNAEVGAECSKRYYSLGAGGGHRSNADLDGDEYANEYLFAKVNLFLPVAKGNRIYLEGSVGKLVTGEQDDDGNYPYWYGGGIEHVTEGFNFRVGWLQSERNGGSRSLGSLGLGVKFKI